MAIFAVCFLLNALDGIDVLAISYAAPLLAKEWEISSGGLGAVFSSGLFGMTMGALFLAPHADRFGRKAAILFSVALTGLGVLLTALAQSVETLMILRFISGLGVGTMLASISTIAAEFSPNKQRNLIINIISAGFPIGAALFGLIAADIIPSVGWRGIFVLAGIATLLTFPLVWFVVPESLLFLARARPKGALANLNQTLKRIGLEQLSELPSPPADLIPRSVKSLFSQNLRQSTICIWLSFFMSFATLYFLASWIPKLASTAGLSLNLAIYSGVVFNVGAAVGTIIAGYMSQKIGLKPTIFGFLVLSSLAMVSFTLVVGSSAVLPVFGLIGLLLQGGFVTLIVVAARLYPTEIRTTGVGWAIGAGRTGGIAGPIVAGFMLATTMSMAESFRWFAIPLVIAALLTLFIRLPTKN